MSLPEVARRYADNLFRQTFHEATRNRDQTILRLRNQHASRGSIKSSNYLMEEAGVLTDVIRTAGEAKAEGFLGAYFESGSPLDEKAFQEIKSEVVNFCSDQQDDAVAAIGQTIRKFFGAADTTALCNDINQHIVRDVSAIISYLVRKLEIERDKVILGEMKSRRAYAAGLGKRWDVFVCHASEDKESFVRPLAAELQKSGLSVWYDESALTVGDSLRRKIDEGLAHSRYGVVVLSDQFFAKNWPQRELDGLMSKEVSGTGTKVILPIWHNISIERLREYSPMLAGRMAVKSDEGLETVVRKLREAMGL